ncbi:hypothetical protein HC928_14910 [bacterium]|nr:hypothetical protein [bacterium]
MAVIPVDFAWSDVGSWASLFEVVDLDADGNHFRTPANQTIAIDTRNTLVYTDRMAVTIGVQDLILVDTGDVIMICHKDHAQDVKQVVNRLRAEERHDYL